MQPRMSPMKQPTPNASNPENKKGKDIADEKMLQGKANSIKKQYLAAIILYKEALEFCKSKDFNFSRIGSCRKAIAENYAGLAELKFNSETDKETYYKKAVKHYKKSLKCFNSRKTFSLELEQLEYLIAIKSEISRIYESLNNFDKAISYAVRVIKSCEILRKKFPDEDETSNLIILADMQERAAQLNEKVCCIYQEKKDYKQAITYAVAACKLAKQFGGDDTCEIEKQQYYVCRIDQAANLYEAAGNYSVALKYYNDALSIYLDLEMAEEVQSHRSTIARLRPLRNQQQEEKPDFKINPNEKYVPPEFQPLPEEEGEWPLLEEIRTINVESVLIQLKANSLSSVSENTSDAILDPVVTADEFSPPLAHQKLQELHLPSPANSPKSPGLPRFLSTISIWSKNQQPSVANQSLDSAVRKNRGCT